MRLTRRICKKIYQSIVWYVQTTLTKHHIQYFFETLPAKWQEFDCSRFSKDLSACEPAQAGKTLFDFQKQRFQNIIKGLWFYFKENILSSIAGASLQKGNIDIAETLSNFTGKWIKKIEADKVWLEGMDIPIDTNDLDYKLIKPLIWWE